MIYKLRVVLICLRLRGETCLPKSLLLFPLAAFTFDYLGRNTILLPLCFIFSIMRWILSPDVYVQNMMILSIE